MPERETLGEMLARRGVSRRALLKYSAYIATLMALPASVAPAMAEALAKTRRQSVIWLSFQECTGCTESLTRSFSPTLEDLIFNLISLDYHHTLQAASGAAAEEAREAAMRDNKGKYIVVVDGSVPAGNEGYSTIAGIGNVQMLQGDRGACRRRDRGRHLRGVRRHSPRGAQSRPAPWRSRNSSRTSRSSTSPGARPSPKP